MGIDILSVQVNIILEWKPKDLAKKKKKKKQKKKILLMVSQHWFRWWLVAWRHQAITWNNVDEDLWHCIVSFVQSELNWFQCN